MVEASRLLSLGGATPEKGVTVRPLEVPPDRGGAGAR